MLETIWESRRLPDYVKGGVAQLGEHLPCKQGVKSSNLSVSIGNETEAFLFPRLFLENRIQKKLYLKKTSEVPYGREAVRISKIL